MNGKGLIGQLALSDVLDHARASRRWSGFACATGEAELENPSDMPAAQDHAKFGVEVTPGSNGGMAHSLESRPVAVMHAGEQAVKRALEQRRINAQEIENLFRQRKLSGRQVKLPVADEGSLRFQINPRLGEATTYRFDLEMESDSRQRFIHVQPVSLQTAQFFSKVAEIDGLAHKAAGTALVAGNHVRVLAR